MRVVRRNVRSNKASEDEKKNICDIVFYKF